MTFGENVHRNDSTKLDAMLSRLQASKSLREVATLQSSEIPTLDAMIGRFVLPTESPSRRRDARRRLAWAVAPGDRRSRRSAPPNESRCWRNCANECQELADMDFSFLFDESPRLVCDRV